MAIRLHESVKVDLETYGRENRLRIVKPFLLVIARDTTHAAELMALIKSNDFFQARYADKVIQVDSSVREDGRRSRSFSPSNTTTIRSRSSFTSICSRRAPGRNPNLYTIMPLRAANARTLIEQKHRARSTLRGKRTGVTAVDRLNIVAHDRFQEIIDEANNPNSPIRLKQLVLDAVELTRKTVTVVVAPTILGGLGFAACCRVRRPPPSWDRPPPVAFTDPDDMPWLATRIRRDSAELARAA